jgi:sugar lactone lactonase YvrE
VSDFKIVDLASQGSAVAQHVRGWQKEEILAWLGRRGKLRAVHPDDPDVYSFLTPAGIQTAFILRDNGEFLIVADHTTYRLE